MYIVRRENGEDICILREDGTFIPFCEDNIDYREYLLWVAEGNVAEIVEIE